MTKGRFSIMPKIVLTNVTKRWGNFYAVDNLNLTIDDGSFVTLLGPSGCGKTTTLRMIAGLETPTSGRIEIGDSVVFDSDQGINIPPNKRRVGFLFQNYALWPNMTVYQNIAFGLGNVKGEMPTVNFEAKKCAKIAEILATPGDVVAIIEECRGKNGKIDTERAYVKLIDNYSISMNTAKELFGYNLHEGGDNKVKAAKIAEKRCAEVLSLREEAARKGYTLNDNFEYVKDGAVVTSVRKFTKEEIDLTVRRVSRIVKIGMFMDRYPAELSGGQQQRVAIARTLAPQPSVLFMDEPLSNLDAKLRLEMRSELQRLHHTMGSTFVYVTHDQMEAMTLATKICLIENGILRQYDAPLEVYYKPNNTFVADFVGNPAINFVEVTGKQASGGDMDFSVFDTRKCTFSFAEPLDLHEWKAGECELDKSIASHHAAMRADKKNVEKGNKDTTFRYHIAKVEEDIDDERECGEDDYVLGIRPETVQICDEGGIEGEIYSAMPTGIETTVRIKVGNYLLTGVVFGGVIYSIGQKVHVWVTGNGVMLFSRASGRFIGTGSLEL